MTDSGVVLVTGATGFVGAALLPVLIMKGWTIRALTRQEILPASAGRLAWHRAEGFDDELPLEGCSVVVHLAARVHVMHEHMRDPLAEFRRVNVELTERLARRASAAGVRRFVYLSSVKVNGEETSPGRAYLADDIPKPEDAYGVSKCEAEIALRRVAAETGLEVVIIRPPLVYGPGVKGNFKTMLRWLEHGLPLPLRSVNNRRSLISVDNLCDLISLCLTHSKAANETFLASDDRDLSTPELLFMAGVAIGRPALLFPFPKSCLEWGAALLGRRGVMRRLCGDLQVDIEKTRSVLGWAPVIDVETGLCRVFVNKV
ncbi:MAG: SDR family oxidoreductase [Betaproteobacteria bacterium]